MVHIITAYRDILMFGQQPNWFYLFFITIAVILLLPVGYQVFCRQSHRFVEEL
ncbi:MAG: hypothetical protein HC800_25220 [Phormidesmis sp. RL_2_1]|nr:hypothetical protein [Phormidesmis sp. RL_2_1]